MGFSLLINPQKCYYATQGHGSVNKRKNTALSDPAYYMQAMWVEICCVYWVGSDNLVFLWCTFLACAGYPPDNMAVKAPTAAWWKLTHRKNIAGIKATQLGIAFHLVSFWLGTEHYPIKKCAFISWNAPCGYLGGLSIVILLSVLVFYGICHLAV